MLILVACVPNNIIKDGEEYIYNDDHTLLFKNTFKKGVLHGEQLTFNHLFLVIKENYNNGKLNGQRVSCHTNGNIFSIQNYIEGKKEGSELFFSLNKKLTHIAHFKNNELNGDEVNFNDFGELISKKKYKLGKQDGEEFYYYSNGITRSKTVYKEGKPTLTIEYNEQGKILKSK